MNLIRARGIFKREFLEMKWNWTKFQNRFKSSAGPRRKSRAMSLPDINTNSGHLTKALPSEFQDGIGGGLLCVVPVLLKRIEEDETDQYDTAAVHMQGWRQTMEDYTTVELALGGHKGWSFFAVFDGHIDDQVALTASQSLPAKLTQKIQELNGFNSDDTASLVDAIEKSFLEFDSDLMQSKKFESGSTCTSVLVTPTHYLFANVGDSRSVLVSRDKIRFETKDHKPTDFPERQRINRCGGYVQMNRVNGNLALSRAFGDFFLKEHYEGTMFNKSYNQLQQPVIALPTVTTIERNPENDQYLLLGCDGVFDVFMTSQLVQYTTNRFTVYKTVKEVALDLVDTSFARGSTDNISVLLVSLENNKRLDEESVKAEQNLDKEIAKLIDQFLEGRKNRQNQSNQDLIFSLFQFLNASIPKNLLPPGAGLSSKSIFVKDYLYNNYSHLL